jgi:AAA+ ATPase superfamily predicted ATPase
MNTFIGREREQADFRELLAKKNSSLVTCHGRRRIGLA